MSDEPTDDRYELLNNPVSRAIEAILGPAMDEDRADAGPAPRESAELRAGGFSVKKMNERYALVMLGSKTVVFDTQPGLLDDSLRMITIEAFHTYFLNKVTEVRTRDGKVKTVTWSEAWLTAPGRREYFGIEFFPDPNNAPGRADFLNTWRGFSVPPRHKRNGYPVFKDHLLTNVCRGDPALFNWLFGSFAHMFQRPRERIGIAIVFRGKKGAGKSIIGETIGSLLGPHYLLVDSPRYLVGNFNAHMSDLLLLQADEAVWAGDKTAEGRLKSLITSSKDVIEAKHVDPVRRRNYVHVLMTANDDWVVFASKDERRYAVFDIDDHCIGKFEYFAEIDAEMAAGGREGLLYDLLNFDLSKIPLRTIPKTDALLDQKIESLDSVDAWWLSRLEEGAQLHGGTEWKNSISREQLYLDYIHASDRTGVRRKMTVPLFGKRMFKLVDRLKKHRPYMEVRDERGAEKTVRAYCYEFPPLEACRAFWDKQMGQRYAWPADEAEQPAEGEDEFS